MSAFINGGLNDTIRKFGYPQTLIREYAYWMVLVRPAQPTLGALVLAAKGEATAFGDLLPGAHAELATITRDIETALKTVIGYDRINYLMLMMVDPYVHFHVIPRYAGSRSGAGLTIEDAGWPKPPALGEAHSLSETETSALVALIQSGFPAMSSRID